MESKKKAFKERNKKHEEEAKIVPWEDYQQELVRLLSLSSALHQANQKKSLIQQKLNSLLQLEAESLNWSNELGEMWEKLEARKLVMGNKSMQSKVVQEKAKKQEEQLNSKIRSLLMAGTALSVASRRLQEAHKSLAGERGCVHLRNLQKVLRMRQQFLVSQISLLYPVKVVIGHRCEQELESCTSSSRSGNPSGLKPPDAASLTISGLHLSVLPFTKMNFFTDRKEVLRSATALGYIAHAVSLLASYLEIPLRYPIQVGASRTYICDYAPSVESISELMSTSLPYSPSKPMEFPLFLEGQDTTRSAYACFLLNKDVEQLLNLIGVESLGPRHVLANFKELLNNILSPQYVYSS